MCKVLSIERVLEIAVYTVAFSLRKKDEQRNETSKQEKKRWYSDNQCFNFSDLKCYFVGVC